jgi:hypothetical protein
VGKTTLAACLAEWWFSSRRRSVITTAPTMRQVEELIWGQGIRVNRYRAHKGLPGTAKAVKPAITTSAPDWWLKGFATDKPERAQGPHLDDLLVIVDEATGVSRAMMGALKGWLTTPGCRLLCIGNPNPDRTSEFWRAFHERAGAVGTVHISCFDSPYVTPEWIEKRKEEWGENSIEYQARVLGEFPSDASDKAIPHEWIRAAQDLWPSLPLEDGPVVKAAWDVAAGGKDHNALVYLAGQRIHVADYWQEPDLIASAHRVFAWIQSLPQAPRWLMVDATGLGQGAYWKLAELWREHEEKTCGCNLVRLDYGGSTQYPSECARKVDELYWLLRRALNPVQPMADRLALPPPEVPLPGGLTAATIAGQLNTRTYKYNEKGRFKVESKAQIASRGGGSPDVADAMVALLDQPPHTEITLFS